VTRGSREIPAASFPLEIPTTGILSAMNDLPSAPGRLTVPETVVYRDLDGEAVLLETGSGTYYGLDEVGTRVWHTLVDRGSIEGAVADLLREYEVTEDRLRADVAELTQNLVDRGLLRHEPS
jgi:hypothetical protein